MTAETDRLVDLSKVDPHAIKDAVLRQRQRALDCIVRQKDDTWQREGLNALTVQTENTHQANRSGATSSLVDVGGT